MPELEPIPSSHYADEEYFEPFTRRYILGDAWSLIRIRDVMKAASVKAGTRVLDAGCAHGTFSVESAKRGAQAYGVDYSATALHLAQRTARFILGEDRVVFVNSTVTDMPFADEGFDVVICADLVEHLTPAQFGQMATEFVRVLRPGGRLVLYTPVPNSLLKRWAGVWVKEEAESLDAEKLRQIAAGQGLRARLGKVFVRLWQAEVFPRFDEVQRLARQLGSQPLYPVVGMEPLLRNQEKYEYLHVDLKSPRMLTKTLERRGLTTRQIQVTKTGWFMQKLPYPLNMFWGGHATLVFEKRK